MPTRLIYEKICDSVTLAELTADEERLFHRLVVKADDYGRFHAHPSILRGSCFPLLLDSITSEQVGAWRDRLVEVGLIVMYAAGGREYLQFLTWPSYQRLRGSKPKFPDPPSSGETLPQLAADCGSRVVKTRNPVADGRRPVAGSRESMRAGARAPAADAAPKAKGQTGRKSSGKTSPPDNLEPTDTDYRVGEAVGLSRGQVDFLVGAMLDYFRGKGEQRADWHATFRNWIRNSPRYDRGHGAAVSRNGQPPGGGMSDEDLVGDIVSVVAHAEPG